MVYVIDPYCEEPIMLINKHIGYDAIDGMGINGALFQEELLLLDTMKPKRIQVWINSIGGNVMEGYNISSAILNSKTPVDTYNMGIAASISAVIFMTGRKRFMADYACLMIHDPYNPNGGTADKKVVDAMSESLCMMLSAKSGISKEKMAQLTAKETWMDVSECLENGMATDPIITSDTNKKWIPQKTEAKLIDTVSVWKGANQVINSILKPENKNTMAFNKVTAKLGLNEAATEDNIVDAIRTMESRAEAAEVRVITQENDHKTAIRTAKDAADALILDANNKVTAAATQLTTVQASLAAKETEFLALKAKFDILDAEKNAAVASEKKTNATAMVMKYVKTGQLKNDSVDEKAGVDQYIAMAVENLEGVEKMLKAIPLSGKAPVITEVIARADGSLPITAMGYAVRAKLKREGKLV